MDYREYLKDLISDRIGYGVTDDILAEYNNWLIDTDRHDDCIYGMDDLDQMMDGYPPHTVIMCAVFGDFNPNDDYFGFNAYGNLVSYSKWEISSVILDNADYLDWLVDREISGNVTA